LGVFGTIVLLCVAGALAGLVSERLREAELTRARAQIREEVARKLHDGVLQTLAVIQRRSNDDELVALARDQESELRSFITAPSALSASNSGGSGGAVWDSDVVDHLTGSLRTALRQQEKRYSIKCELVVVDEPDHVSDAVIVALTGAVSEAVTNASKHGHARTVTVFVDSEPDRVICEVADDGSGFDASNTTEGIGLSRSVRGRIEEVGGSVEVTSVIGRGTRVRLSVPL
ncbi:MAG: ATP-binding protein, partial [Microthrixaceae bacterium]|nr:ATP-binding protein [Microthrixaceae bacterium]